MTLRFSANIVFDAKDNNKNLAIFNSVNTDNKFYPENPTKTKISFEGDSVNIDVFAEHLPHLRANLNSVLRLLQASYDTLEKVKI